MSHLTTSETQAVARAEQLLERTQYDEPGAGDPRLVDARMIARSCLEIADAIEAERSARIALKERCETQQNILGRRVYEAISANGNGHIEHDDEP